MKKSTGILLAVCLHALFLQTASAQDRKTALVPLPSVNDFTRGDDGWALGLGLAVEYESAYEGSDEFGVEVDPAGAVQWRKGDDIFFFAGEALGWRGLRSDTWLFEAVVGFDEGRQESDSDDGRLDGLGDQDEGAEVALQVRRAFDADWRYWLDGRVVTEDNGNLGLLAVGRRFGDQIDGTGHEIAIAVVFQDSDLANKDFGIDAEQSAASGLNETELSGGFRSIGFNYNYRHYVNENWQLFGEAVYEGYSSDIQDSPITRNDYEAEVGVGFIYVF
ncbi:outer membrane scaffolding protein for murein synthesis (MipA/OmpV family) [Halospina denitrificans]|uniref:Outer membrane scaffolding protein for murein synthesis (MipA/OmpV family) n=1 Tax=Halospina denitrificans TaxID=332522 RepID=A0A4V3EPK1_9GAMM|nr:MipA/OmpV family protein [Halospina denitrificans]TDT37678.1 outer membrane scaffolding protein for murein synthesis (MipA/OmpV family) [Halospina denitrificans]